LAKLAAGCDFAGQLRQPEYAGKKDLPKAANGGTADHPARTVKWPVIATAVGQAARRE
jgi:hypothetical protein